MLSHLFFKFTENRLAVIANLLQGLGPGFRSLLSRHIRLIDFCAEAPDGLRKLGVYFKNLIGNCRINEDALWEEVVALGPAVPASAAAV